MRTNAHYYKDHHRKSVLVYVCEYDIEQASTQESTHVACNYMLYFIPQIVKYLK